MQRFAQPRSRRQAGARILLAVPVVAAAFAALPGMPAPATARDLDTAARYGACLALVERDPDAAYDRAETWRLEGGGAAARHCGALALVALDLHAEAAVRLGDLADAPDAGGPADRAAILGQAGNAWLLAGRTDNARAAFDAALALTPDDADLLVDRARAHAALEDPAAAARDLSRALVLRPDDPTALMLRASALRAQNRLAEAHADIERALALAPSLPDALPDVLPDALVERGAIRLALGDADGARADWVRAAELIGEVAPDDPRAPALKAARRALEALDLGPNSDPGQAPAPIKP